MNLCLKKQLFLCNLSHNIGIRSYLQWRASALEGFPNLPTSYLPLSGVYLYYFGTETILQNHPKNYFQSQSNINSLESGTIAMIYKCE